MHLLQAVLRFWQRMQLSTQAAQSTKTERISMMKDKPLELHTTRKIDKLIIHCSATPHHMDIGVEQIDNWHRMRGWSQIGYHFVIRRDGTLEHGRPVKKMGAHVKGYNRYSIGICLVGGVNADMKAENNFTWAQWRRIEQFARLFKVEYPKATIHGHNEFTKYKECPSFDVQEWLNKNNI